MHTHRPISPRNACIAVAAVLAGAAPLGACRVVEPPTRSLAKTETPREPSVSTPSAQEADPASSRWPARWGDHPETRGVVVELNHPFDELAPAHLSRFHQLRVGVPEYTDADLLAGALGIEDSYRFKAEGPGCFVFTQTEPSDQIDDDPPELAFRFVSATETGAVPTGAGAPETHVELERTWFTYRRAEGHRATLVLMPGMFGTPEPVVNAMETYFLAKGWSVIRMLSQPSRFTEHMRVELEEDAPSEALKIRLIAREYDTRTAECAYAVRAAMDFVHQRYPDDASAPTALVGMSGGAIILPTVYAYSPERFDAATLIAGGGNSFEISARSNYASWIDAIEIDADPSDEAAQPLKGERLAELSALYLEHAPLDPINTAPEMRGIPVLMLHASADRAVPASTGDALHRALGEPERWVYPVGHELIFASLPLQIPKIESWLSKQITGSDSANDSAPGETGPDGS